VCVCVRVRAFACLWVGGCACAQVFSTPCVSRIGACGTPPTALRIVGVVNRLQATMFLLWDAFELPAVVSGLVSTARPREVNLQAGDMATLRVGLVGAFTDTVQQQELQRLRQQQQQQQQQQQRLRMRQQEDQAPDAPAAAPGTS
jgi:hypothetical protein